MVMFMERKKIIILLSIVILIVLLFFYINYENNSLQISNYEITNNKIPNEFNDYKIIQISDFHNTKSTKLTNTLVKEIENQKPNLILITGDLIDSRTKDINVAIDFVKKIKKCAPIYFVSGNHEARISDYSELKAKLRENDVIILDNKVDAIELNDSKIKVLGIDDPSMVHESSITDKEIIKTEINYLEYDRNSFNILLSHRPELFNVYVENEIDLVLSGHAHGGQIRIPFIGGLVAPNQGLFPKYTSGKYMEQKTTMIVSRGIGNSILPYRINNKPELVIITLKNV